MLRHHNYTGIVEYDPDGRIFTGEVIGVRDVIAFQGRTPEEIEQSFRAAVDLYLEMCQQDGVLPQKPFSGRVNIRLSPEVHRQIAEKAALQHVSLNQWVAEAVTDALHKESLDFHAMNKQPEKAVGARWSP
jgi:predicted HicB family RNase H-like nuclease